MLFTAPAFIFVFLPLSVIFCLMLGEKIRRVGLALVGAAFYILLNISTPVNLIWVPLLIIYAYFSARLIASVKKSFLGVVLGVVPLIWLVLIRQLAYYDAGYAYPVGITLPVMCVSAYIWDVHYGDKVENNFARLLVYFLYFPIMIVGPFVGYSEFSSLLDEKYERIGLENISIGIRLYAVGFIKRIAVGAVLIDGYAKIFEYSWEAPDFAIIFLLLLLIYFGVFFSFSGYLDMAVGISQMYGVRLSPVMANPLTVATTGEYSRTLFGSVREWTERYVIIPLSRRGGKNISTPLKIALYALCTVAVIRTDIISLMIAGVLFVFSLVSSCLKLDKKYKEGRTGIRVVFGAVTVVVLGAFWLFMTIGTLERTIWDYLADMYSGNAEYQTDMVLISFSALKYLCVFVIALVTLLPQAKWLAKRHEAWNDRQRAVADYIWLGILLALFIFTIVFFLPQYDEYDYMPFRYIII